MAYIDHIDPINRDIHLHADTVTMGRIHPIEIYREMRTMRREIESLRQYYPFLSAKGMDYKGVDYNGQDKYTERYVIENRGTRIVPYNVSHTLTIIGIIITDDGQEGIACVDRTPLSGTTHVDINYLPPQVEVITISTGTAATIATVQAGLTAQGVTPARAVNLDFLDATVSSRATPETTWSYER